LDNALNSTIGEVTLAKQNASFGDWQAAADEYSNAADAILAWKEQWSGPAAAHCMQAYLALMRLQAIEPPMVNPGVPDPSNPFPTP
jgi:hypothetical protein